MRTVVVSFALFASLLAAGAAQAQGKAERKMFIITADVGYGVDRCLANGSACGAPAAAAYCKTQNFATALSFRKVDRDDITGSLPAGGSGGCTGAGCDDVVAIVCSR